jgi:hypothetical protein
VLVGEFTNPNSKWGYIDTAGQFVISPQLRYQNIVDRPGAFSEGLATFHEGEKIGYINRSGQVVIPPQFTYACPFSDNRAGVLLQRQHFVIDRSGHFVLGPLQAGLGCFSEGVAPINTGHGWSYIDTQGNVVIRELFDFASEFSEGLASVVVGGKYAYINKTGKTVIPPFVCRWAGNFKEGLARVATEPQSWEYWEYIDKTGKVVIPPFQVIGAGGTAEDFSEGLARVGGRSNLRFVDRHGKTVLSSVADTKDQPNMPTAAPATPSQPAIVAPEQQQADVPGAWDIARAMKLVYGSYDPVTRTAFWSDPNPPADKHFDFHSEKGGTVQPVLDAPFVDGTAQKRFVVTATSPAGEDFDCHGCGPLLGVFVFVNSDAGWALESQERFFAQEGSWGKPPDTELVRLAGGHYGVKFTASYIFQGETSSSTFIAEPVGSKILVRQQKAPYKPRPE